ncbi:TonB-dependent receptor [Pollutibacter soli]|uniref:TonB-dependent receptor n=1 Tax=Pollutibacter soli TaxID=3034157 RepID=UPI003013A519
MRISALIILLLGSIFSGDVLGQASFKVRGRVLDFDTHQPIKDASVMITETQSGTVTDDSGFFSVNVFVTDATLEISVIGYVTFIRSLHLNTENKFLNITVKKRANEKLDEIVINAFKEKVNVNAAQMNIVKLNPEAIKRAPLLFGEPDIIRALITQPGVTNQGEAAGGFNVRGGNADQNLVLVDGAPLFNTSHLLGFYTSISPDAVQDATLYKGGMPSEYGGRISSLLNLRIKSGFSEKMKFSTGISPVSFRATASGPIIKDKLVFTLGGRVAYPNFILRQFPGKFGDSRAFFYDGIGKLDYQINAKNRLSLTGYTSFDKFKFDNETQYEWRSDLVTANYSSDIGAKFTLRLNGSYSKYASNIDNLPPNYEFRIKSTIAQTQGKASLLYKVSNKHRWEAGINYIRSVISPGTRNPTSDSSFILPFTVEEEQGHELAGFLNWEYDFSERVSLQAGVRYTGYAYLGEKKVYHYEEGVPMTKESITDSTVYGKNKPIANYGGFEPRITLRVSLTDDFSFKASYNRGQQFLQLITNTTAISPVDFWKLSDSHLKAQYGDQFAAGFFKNFSGKKYEASIEGYYKKAKNLLQYKDGAKLLLNPYIETALLNSQSRGYGIEFSLIKNEGVMTGQVNYTYSRTKVQVMTPFSNEQVNNGQWYPADTDRPHNLAVITKFRLGKGWTFNANFVYVSGRPATYPDGTYSYNGTIVFDYSKRNTDRLPANHRLDIGLSYVTKRFQEQKNYSVWNISIYNVYGYDNAYSIYFIRNAATLQAKQLSIIDSAIPSITWNYYF